MRICITEWLVHITVYVCRFAFTPHVYKPTFTLPKHNWKTKNTNENRFCLALSLLAFIGLNALFGCLIFGNNCKSKQNVVFLWMTINVLDFVE